MSTDALPPPKNICAVSETWPPKPTWTSEDVPDLTGQVIIVTGGNTGIRKETCRVLLSKNAKVYLAARSESKANAAIEELKTKTGKSDLQFLQLDLADLPSVRKAAEEFMSKEQQLHVLYNNGGVMVPPIGNLTAQGYDSQFGTNVLGHFFFTALLLPVLLRIAKGQVSGKPTKVRVVNVSSSGHEFFPVSGGINWETLEKGDKSLKARKKLGLNKLYGQSKLGNIIFSNELARRYGDQGLVSISVHPGGIKTDLQRNVDGGLMGFLVNTLSNVMLYDVSFGGVITQLYAGTSEEALKMNGEYLTAWARRQTPNEFAHDRALSKKMWTWCEDQVKDF